MTGDAPDILARLKRVLPAGWFGADGSYPLVETVLSGAAQALAFVYSLYAFAKLQTRIVTATGGWLDLAANDFFGPAFHRYSGESDASFSRRIRLEVFRDRNTRTAIDRALFDITGDHPEIYEAWRPGDCGGLGSGSLAYGVDGLYASRGAPCETIVSTPLPQNYGIPNRTGWGDPLSGYGQLFSYVDNADAVGSGPTLSDILGALEAVRTAAVTCYVRFTQLGDDPSRAPVVVTSTDGVPTAFIPPTSGGGATGGGGGGPLINSIPTPLTVQSGATPATMIATLSAPALHSPTFSIVSPSGRYAVSGASLLVGLVDIDISNGTSDFVIVHALDVDGITSETAILPITVTAPAAVTGNFDLNFVSGYYAGGSLGDLSIVQAAALSQIDSTGASSTFPANTVRRNDLGVWVVGTTATYIGRKSMDLSGWDVASVPGFAAPVRTILSADANGFIPATYESTNNISGLLYPGAAMEPVTTADVLTVKARLKDLGGGFILAVRTVTGADGSTIATIGAGFNSGVPNVTTVGAGAAYQGYVRNLDGTTDFIWKYTVQASTSAMQFGVNSLTATSGQKVEVHGLQAVRGPADLPWLAVTTASVTQLADDLSLGGAPGATLGLTAGWIGIEVQGLDYATIGTVAVTSNPAGDLLKLGSTSLLTPAGPSGFKAKGGAVTPLGLSGFRGIVRIGLAWDASGWTAYANGGVVATGSGTTGAAGVVKLLAGVTGRIRRLSGGASRLSDAGLKAWTQIYNKTFVRPGNALTPGAAAVTFHDDFDTNSLQTITTPAFPYSSTQNLALAYGGTGLWKPRFHNHTQNVNGSFPNHDGQHELQFYADPQVAANYQTITFSGGEMVGYTNLTSNLTSPQQALVPENPDTPGTKATWVSWCLSTFGSDAGTAGGGFNQRFGLWNQRAKYPAFQGSWPAFWIYNYSDTSEGDFEEFYGVNKTQVTAALHADNFGYNAPGGGPVEIGFDVSLDYHDWSIVWIAGAVSKYFDGVLVHTLATGGSFDNAAKFLLLNMAVQPAPSAPFDIAAPAPNTAAKSAAPWVTHIDRVQVLQFGS